MDGAEGPDLLARHLRAVDALLQRRGEQRGPHEEEAAVSAHVELGHDAVDNVRLRGEDVDGVHVALGLAALLEALDVGDVGVEDVVLLDDVVEELLGLGVDDEDLPLRALLAWTGGQGHGHAHVAAGHLADGVENDCMASAAARCTACGIVRSRWMSIMDTMVAGYGCQRRGVQRRVAGVECARVAGGRAGAEVQNGAGP